MGDLLQPWYGKARDWSTIDTSSLDGSMLSATCRWTRLLDFYDRLKSITHGYGSMDYEQGGYRPSDLVKLEILVNGDPVDAFARSCTATRPSAGAGRSSRSCAEIDPAADVRVAIQAAIGSQIIARETVKAMRKNVIAKCYGGDITRKRKLLDKQKEGKKRMKQFGAVEIPQEAFLAVLELDSEGKDKG